MDLNKTREVGIDCLTVKLIGDGTLEPKFAIVDEVSVETYTYVNSTDLRKLANKLNKWAKKLENHVEED